MQKLKQLHDLPINVTVLDPSSTILAVNEAWKDFGTPNGFAIENSGVGRNYLRCCSSKDPHLLQLANKLRDLIAGRRHFVSAYYSCHSPTEKCWCHLIGLPLSLDKSSGIAILHANLTEFLPLPVNAREEPSNTTHAGRVKPTNILDTIAESLVGSVAESLSAKLVSMLTYDHLISAPKNVPEKSDTEEGLSHIHLSKSQVQILGLLGEGKTDKEIAKALRRSPYTIKVHVAAILRQLNLKCRPQAALYASRLPKEVFRK